MNHIKLFEDFTPKLTISDIGNIKTDIENIMLDISDMGYSVSVSNTSDGGIGVFIAKGSTIDLEEISETIIRLYDYMKLHQSFYKRNPIMCQVSNQPLDIWNNDENERNMIRYSHIGWGQIDKRNIDSFNILQEESFFRLIIKWDVLKGYSIYKKEYLD